MQRFGLTLGVAFLFILGFVACSSGDTTLNSDEALPALSEGDIAGTPDEMVQVIAKIVSQEHEDHLIVSYAENPPHRAANGSIFYGSHYIIFVLPEETATASETEAVWREAVGRLYQLTYEYILRPQDEFTHAGVQVIESDAWLIGGHNRGSIIMFEASEQALARVPFDRNPSLWTNAANEQRLNGANFYALLAELERLRKAQQAP